MQFIHNSCVKSKWLWKMGILNFVAFPSFLLSRAFDI